ncbi:hypothetical protein Zm00014a_014042 [Zea mays]|uniref:Uncharacterized protein n=1 Tax=Zea mays TaxID=4577 RepID=A0A3L6DX20_MAIZE|nr:hypothetical protein Zm00014a_014042 [Zea mays]
MVETHRSSTAAAGKRTSPSPSSSSVPPPKRPKAESLGSPTASAPGRAEEDSVAGAAPARSAGSVDDAAAVAQKDLILWPFVFAFIYDNHHFRNNCLYAAISAKGHKRSRFENQIKQHIDNRAAMAKEIKSTEDEGYDDYSYEVFFRRRLFDFIVMWNATSIRNDIIRHAEENRGLLSASSFDRQLLRKELVRRVKAAVAGRE